MEEKIYSFKFKITEPELRRILVSHLVLEGCIGPREEALAVGMERKGSSIMVEFAVKTKEETHA